MINSEKTKGIAEVTANLIIPSLIFSDIIKSFRITHYELWLPILIFCVICVVIGYFIGYITSKIFCLKGEIMRLILISNMFSNSTSMQLVYAETLARIFSRFVYNTEDPTNDQISLITEKSNLIVLIYTIFVNFLRWSVGFYLMKPQPEDLQEAQDLNNLLNQNLNQTQIELNHKARPISIHSDSNGSKMKKICREVLNIPFVCGIVAIVLSAIPYLNSYMRNPKSIVYGTIIDSLGALGKCSSSMTIFLLGLNISLTILKPRSDDEIEEPLNVYNFFNELKLFW